MGRTKTNKVYILRAENTDKVYIGSTRLSLQKRLCCHRYKKCTTRAVELLEYGTLSIELLEKVDDRAYLKHRELDYINMFKSNGANVVNKYNPIRV